MGVISVTLGALSLLLPSLLCQKLLPWPCTASRREFAACVEVVAAVPQIYLCFTPSYLLRRGNLCFVSAASPLDPTHMFGFVAAWVR